MADARPVLESENVVTEAVFPNPSYSCFAWARGPSHSGCVRRSPMKPPNMLHSMDTGSLKKANGRVGGPWCAMTMGMKTSNAGTAPNAHPHRRTL